MLEKILLIDDDYATNLFHKIVLEGAGLVKIIETVSSVDEGIQQLTNAASPPDVIFLDIKMPQKKRLDVFG